MASLTDSSNPYDFSPREKKVLIPSASSVFFIYIYMYTVRRQRILLHSLCSREDPMEEKKLCGLISFPLEDDIHVL